MKAAHHLLAGLAAAALTLTLTMACGGPKVAPAASPNPAPTAPGQAAFPPTKPGTARTALAVLATLSVAPADPMTGYSPDGRTRLFLPDGWTDPDHNGCNSRRDTLARQAVSNIVKTIPRPGKTACVLTANIRDPYTGNVIPSVTSQVDHVVSTGDAYESGADHWTQAQRETFAQDPLNLLATAAKLNLAKGDKSAAQWVPPVDPCGYVARQIAVKDKWALRVTGPEHDAMARDLAACPGEPLPTTPGGA